MLRALDVELVARRVVECTALIGPDLRFDLEGAQECERAARDRGADEIEMDGDFSSPAQMDAAGDVEETRELGEPIAIRLRCDRGELIAEILR